MINLNILTEDLLPQLLMWRNDERIFKWCRQNDLIDINNHVSWFQRQVSDPTIKMFSIIYDGQLVGCCGLTSIDLQNQRAEFSLYIGPEWQNRGFAEHALKALLKIGFERYPLNVIWGEMFEGNPAEGLFLKCGLKKEGTRVQHYFKNGKFIDAHLFSITRKSYNGTINSSTIIT